jgi:hypothetical protein
VLAFVMCLAPVVQVVAGTLADAHCAAQGHSSAGAGPDAHASMHAHARHGETDHATRHATQGNHGHSHCACPCGLACAPGAALLPTLPAFAFATPERLPSTGTRLHAHAIHSVPQRPPASSTLIV